MRLARWGCSLVPPAKIINFVPENLLILKSSLSLPDNVQPILKTNSVQMERHLITVWPVMPDTKPAINVCLPT